LTPARSSLRVEHRIDAADAVADELRHVLVAGRDHDLEARRSRALGERADHVVRLDTLDAQHRQTERRDRLDERRDLRAQIVRHWGAVRLVFLEELVAESPAGASSTTTISSGSSSFSSLFSMLRTPSTAPVGTPCEVVSGGSAKNAR
jgi:hypothetical protein